MPAAKLYPGSHPEHVPLDLGELIGSEWDGHRFVGRKLYIPGYRGDGYTPGDLRAHFWHVQEIHWARIDRTRLEREMERALEAQHAAEARAEWYRRQLCLESRSGAMLARILAD